MPKLQTMISDEMERKLNIYAAYLGISKNDYIRQILTFWLRQAEGTTIPEEIVTAAIEKGESSENK